MIGGDDPNPSGDIRWAWVDAQSYRQYSGQSVPGFLVRLDPDAAGGFRRQVPHFDAKIGMHIGYALQWAAFALIAVAAWVGLSMRRGSEEPA